MNQKAQIKIRWLDHLRFQAEDEAGHTVLLDTSEEHGGGTAFRPTDLLLVALAGCTGMDVISILQKKRQPVEGFEVVVRGQRAAEHPRRFLHLEVEYVVYGAEVDPAALERAMQLSVEKYCSVHANLAPGTEIAHRYRIVPGPAPR